MKLTRTSTILAMIGAATAGYFIARAVRGGGRTREPRGAALAEGEQHAAGDFSSTRSAGPEAMRDKPREWSQVDQASDESFPASDPAPAGGSRID
jgi:hypothetical protein